MAEQKNIEEASKKYITVRSGKSSEAPTKTRGIVIKKLTQVHISHGKLKAG